MAKIELKLLKNTVVNGSVEWAGTKVTVEADEAARLIAGGFAHAPAGTKDVGPSDAATTVPKEQK